MEDTMRTTDRLQSFLVIALGLSLSLPLSPVLVSPVAAQTATTTTGTVQPVGVNLPAGDDAWMTPPDGGTYVDFVNDPIPAGFFHNSLPFAGKIAFRGIPLVTNPTGALGVADTLVRRTGRSGALAVGQSATVSIVFVALSLGAIQPITVTNADLTTEQWDVRAGLTGPGQTVGSMTITRAHADGGTYDSTLHADVQLVFTQTNPPTGETRTLVETMTFSAPGESWTLVAGPGGFQPSQLQIDPLPGGVELDVDGDGQLDNVFTIGRSNFQVGVRWNPTGGAGGGGSGECDGSAHINGQSKIETHTSFLAGDSDADGMPNDCDPCTDADGDGVDDLTGETCSPECEDTDATSADSQQAGGEVSDACPKPTEI
jgi:hypothetical protein